MLPRKGISDTFTEYVSGSRGGLHLVKIRSEAPQKQIHIAFQFKETALARLAVPGFLRSSGDEHRERRMLLVGSQRLAVHLRITAVNGAIFKEFHRRDLTVQVVCHNLKAAEYEGLPHHVQV